MIFGFYIYLAHYIHTCVCVCVERVCAHLLILPILYILIQICFLTTRFSDFPILIYELVDCIKLSKEIEKILGISPGLLLH